MRECKLGRSILGSMRGTEIALPFELKAAECMLRKAASCCCMAAQSSSIATGLFKVVTHVV